MQGIDERSTNENYMRIKTDLHKTILEEIDLNALSMDLNNPDDVLMESLDIEDEALLQLYEDYQVQDSLL